MICAAGRESGFRQPIGPGSRPVGFFRGVNRGVWGLGAPVRAPLASGQGCVVSFAGQRLYQEEGSTNHGDLGIA